ncbi:MAG: flagellar biosynthesis/type III secretory pathway chaperone [Myxococcota bacterium]|jgi:flagellar biosynthesis/type III secretory pathway chaperone
MNHLLAVLDEEVCVLEALVQVTQKEQQHLLAFEPAGLELLLDQKSRLLAREEDLRAHRERLVGSGRTLLQHIESLPGQQGRVLATRRSRLRALLGALGELNQVAGLHAKRQLRWVRQCRKRLEVKERNGASYGPQGRRSTHYGSGRVLSASV